MTDEETDAAIDLDTPDPKAEPDHCEVHRAYDEDCIACRAYQQGAEDGNFRETGS